MHVTTNGIVLRAVNIGENDKLLTVLTDSYGKITVLSKGAKSLKSKLAPSSQVFAYSKLTLFKYKNKYSVDNAELIEMFYELRNDIEKLSLAQYFAELTAFLAAEETENNQILSLFLNTLFVLAKKEKNMNLIKAVFELKAMALAGYMPDINGCRHCDSTESGYFCLKDGYILCGNCSGTLPKECILISAGLLAAFEYILCADNNKIFGFEMPDDALKQLSIITERYINVQLEHSFATLTFLKSITNT